MSHLRLVPSVDPAAFAASNVSVAGTGCIAVARVLARVLAQHVEEEAPTPADARGSHVRLTPEASLDAGLITRFDPGSAGDAQELVRAREIVARQLRLGSALVMNARIPAEAVTFDPALLRAHLRLVVFAADPADPTLREHLHRGGRGFAVHQGWVTEHQDGDFYTVVPVSGVKVALELEDLVAVIAACRVRGVSREAIAAALGLASAARQA